MAQVNPLWGAPRIHGELQNLGLEVSERTVSRLMPMRKELEAMSGASLDQAQWNAKIYAVLNEKDRALIWLERGLATGALGAFYKDDSVWDAISGDPRFGELLRRMGIPQ